MIATDRLIAMLGERGVEYVIDHEYGEKYPPEQRVTWSVDLAGEDMTVTARDYCIGKDDSGEWDYCLDLEFHEVFTPEQAIAATLGRGTCHDMYTDDDEWFACSECNTELRVHEPFGVIGSIRFCPNCGARIENDG